MRIVGGNLAGRKILPPTSLTTRPMMDRIRQALFNIIEHHDWGRNIGDIFFETDVLDPFCGTGALAFEAISRGARFAHLFDRDREAIRIATENARALGLTKDCAVRDGDALKPPKAANACRLIFMAPPYRKGLIAPAIKAFDDAGWIKPHPLIVAETAKKEELEILPDFQLLFSRFYADTALHFLTR